MSRYRPEPVLDEAKIASTVSGVVTALASVAVAVGVLTAEETSALVDAAVIAVGSIVTLVNVVAPIWRAKVAREKVTPLDDPRDNDGIVLVRPLATP